MIEIGYKLSSEEFGPTDLVRYARRAEQAGFGFALISDHAARAGAKRRRSGWRRGEQPRPSSTRGVLVLLHVVERPTDEVRRRGGTLLAYGTQWRPPISRDVHLTCNEVGRTNVLRIRTRWHSRAHSDHPSANRAAVNLRR
jgi:hypothetical protein